MNKIIEYTNLMQGLDNASYDSIPKAVKDLTIFVNSYIVENWEPVGNIVITDRFVIQTMVRRSIDKPTYMELLENA